MFCGAGSFSRVDEDDGWSPPTPKGSRRKQGSRNPYSTRGLEQFSMVLADLESRREKILAREGAQGASLVHFMYSNSRDWVPIVVRPREPLQEEKPKKAGAAKAENARGAGSGGVAPAEAAPNRVERKESFSWKVGDREGDGLRSRLRWNPSCFWPTVVVLILLGLVFGRVFAICCTSVWWYLVPGVKGDERRSVRRSVKSFGRKVSDKRLGAGGAGDVGATPAPQEKSDGGASDGLSFPRHHQAGTKKGK